MLNEKGYQTLQRNANIAWNNPCQEQSVHIFGHTPKQKKTANSYTVSRLCILLYLTSFLFLVLFIR